MSNLSDLTEVLQKIGCDHRCNESDAFWPSEAEGALRGRAFECLTLGQSHLYFDKDGEYLGYVTDDTFAWRPRREYSR